ncbi:putative RNA-directed DNA polymerase [Helianthus anomalus]
MNADGKPTEVESSEKPNKTQLHPTYFVTNVQSKIRTLDGTKVTYTSWIKLFQLHAVAYQVLDHIDGTKPPAENSAEYRQWKELDALVLQWIYSTVSDDLLARVIESDSTARHAWLKLQKIFLSNKKARARALETRFCNLTLSACSSLDDYCQRLKDLANKLEDVDHPVSEERLVLQLVRGLPAEYDTTASLINANNADWDLACSMLQDEVIRLEARQKPTQSVLVAPSQPNNNPSQPVNTSNQEQHQQSNYYSRSRGRGRGRGHSSRGRGTADRGQNSYPHNWASNNPSYPQWAWWNTPPCPYPTQPAFQPQTPFSQQPKGPPPSAQFMQLNQPNTGFGPAHYPTGFSPQQAHYFSTQPTGYNALSPSDLSAAMASMQMNTPDPGLMDTGASSHATDDPGMISSPDPFPVNNKLLVGNGNFLPIQGSGTGYLTLPNRTYILPKLLYCPTIIKKLISVRRFTRDNNVSIEFDPFGFSLKDLRTGRLLSHHNSTGDLYPLTPPELPAQATFLITASHPWHDRLGHPGAQVLDVLSRYFSFPCNKNKSSICHSCQVSNSKRLPFYASNTFTFSPFDIIHCDLWTSPILSKTCYKYYMVLIDNFSHFIWVYPLKYKSETFPTFVKFHRKISTQFIRQIKTFQCDLGGEFDNNAFKTFAIQHGLLFRFSCPQTSSQNGGAERMIRRLNDIIRSLLIHSHLPPTFWVEALHTAAYLHNILPTKRLNFFTPTFALYLRHPTYDHLRVFGCACYPNASATQPHKHHHRATRCIFLGYPPDFQGYRCFDPTTNKVTISRHVTFDKTVFPSTIPTTQNLYQFLDNTPPPGFTFSRPTPTPPPPSTHPTTTSPFPFTYSRRPRPGQIPTAQPAQPSHPAQHAQPLSQHPSQSIPTQTTSTPTPGPPPHTSQPAPSHPMTTRSKTGSLKPPLYSLNTTTISHVPATYNQTFTDPNWLNAM